MSAHAYWRLLVTATSGGGGSSAAVCELEMFDTSGAALCSGGTPSASSYYGDVNTYGPAKAFDGNLVGTDGSFWSSNGMGGGGEWVAYQFASAVDVASFRLTGRVGYTLQYPTVFKLQYSDDGTIWTDATGSLSATWDEYARRRCSFPVGSPASGLYCMWRVRALSTQSGTTPSCAKLEFRSAMGGSDQTDATNGIADSLWGTQYPSLAFDADASTLWNCNVTNVGWLGFAFSTPLSIVEATWTVRNDAYYTQGPSSCVLEASNDGGATWTQIGNTLSPATWAQGATQTLTFVGATNEAPVVEAGPDQTVTLLTTATATLAGSATDDGLPDPPAALTYLWTVVSSPGGSTVTFTDDTDPETDVEFDTLGEYVLRLTADDGELTGDDDVTITVAAPPPARFTQVGADIAWQTAIAARFTQVGVEVAYIADPCEAPPDGEDLTTATSGPLLFSTYDPLGTGALQAYDEVSAPDDADYYGGRKWPWLMSLGPVRRALSDHKGNYEVGRFDVSFADPERRLRQLLATAPGKYTPSREVAAYLVSDAGRRAKVTPHLVAWGLVEGSPKYNSDLSVGLSCRDVIGGGNRGWGLDGEALIPKRLIAAPEFPEARPEVQTLGVPFPLGILGDAGSATGAPTLTGNTDKDRGYIADISGDAAGWGDLPASPAPPTNLVLTETANALADMGTDAHSAVRFFVQVFPFDVNGVMGNPLPFVSWDAGADITLSGRAYQLDASWDASPDAVKYRAVLGGSWYGVGYNQYIETSGTSCTFTKSPDWVPELIVTPSMITPGAQVIPDWGDGPVYYGVAAIMADGDTAITTHGYQGQGSPFRRPRRVEWEAVALSLGYRVYRRGPIGTWTRQWDVAAGVLMLDDPLDDSTGVIIAGVSPPKGSVAPIYVGDVTIDGQTWRELLVAGCAISDITSWAYDDGSTVTWDSGAGTDFLIPGAAGWADRFGAPYRDLVGADGVTRRRTVIYARGPLGDAIAAGTATLRVNLDGVEDVGNGTGVVLTDLYDQAIWLLEQLVLQNYLTGDWTCPPTFPGTSVCQINRSSFRAVGAQRRLEIAGGYVGAWVVGAEGERVSAQQWIQRICQSGQFRIGPNRFWQIKAWALNAALVTAMLPHVREFHAVDKDSGDPVPHPDHLANVLPYTFGPPLDSGTDWLGSAELKDAASITAYGQEYPGDQLSLYCLRSQALAAHAAGQAMLYSRLIPHTIEPVGDLRFTALDLGDAFLYDHYRGLGSDGYSERPFVVIGWTFLSPQRQIQPECLDLGDILTP